MTQKILILYGSRFGHSEKIARNMASTFNEHGFAETVLDISQAPFGYALDGYSGIVLVASVQYGFIDRRSERWVKQNLPLLQRKPTLLVTVSLTARKFGDNPPPASEHSYTAKFLARTAWKPTQIEMAAGILEYPRYNFFDRRMIQLIMHISGGVTDGTSTIEYTNWPRITAAAENFGKLLQS